MALNVGTLIATLRLRDAGWAKGFDKATEQVREAAGEMRSAGVAMLGVAAAIGVAAAAAVKAASDFDETTNVIAVSFGKSAGDVEVWAKETANAMGRGRQAVRETAGDFQALIAPLVASQVEATGMSKRMTELAIDLSSFRNVPMKEAFERIRAGLTGEAEPLRKFGVNMTEAALKTFALSKGIQTKVDKMTTAQKTMLRYNFILEKTALAHGDARETAASFANQMARAKGTIEDLAVAIGTPLKNALAPILTGFNEIAAKIKEMDPGMLEFIAKIGLIAVAVLGAVGGFLAFAGVVGGIAAALPTLAAGLAVAGSAFLAALPFVAAFSAAVFALIVLVGKLYGVWKAFGPQIKAEATSAFSGIADVVIRVGKILLTTWNAIIGFMIESVFALPTATIKAFSVVIDVIVQALTALKPILERAGFGDLAALIDPAGAQSLVNFATDMETKLGALKGTLKDALNPAKALDDVANAAKEIGKFVVDGVKEGLAGAALLLGDLLGVDFNAAGPTTATNGAGTEFDPERAAVDAAATRLNKTADSEMRKWLDKVNGDWQKIFAAKKKAEEEIQQRHIQVIREVTNQYNDEISSITSAFFSGSGFAAAGSMGGSALGGAIGTAFGGPAGGALGGAAGGKIGELLGGLIDKLPALVRFGEVVVEFLSLLVEPLNALFQPLVHLAQAVKAIYEDTFLRYQRLFQRVLAEWLEVVVRLVVAFLPLLAVIAQLNPLFQIMLAFLPLLIRVLESVTDGLLMFVKVMLDVANGLIDIAQSFGAKIKNIDGIDDGAGADGKKAALKAAKEQAHEEAKAAAIAEIKRKQRERALQEEAGGAGTLNLPEIVKLARMRADATSAEGSIATGAGGIIPVPIVQVFINGVEMQDVQTAATRSNRYASLIDTGVVVPNPRRKHNNPGRGN